MKIQYIADDGKIFNDEDGCRSYEAARGMQPTHYAIELRNHSNGKIIRDAREYAKWLRGKQNYPATDSGEHKCCDLMLEMTTRLL